MSDTTNDTVEYGTFRFAISALPIASLVALVSSGLAHKLGNECNSKVSTAKAKRKEAGEPEMTEAEAKAMLATAQAEMVKRINDGTIGTTVRGPKLSPLDRLMREIALGKITTRLTGAGLKVPSGKETVKMGDTEYTIAQLIERRMDAEGDAIRKEAETTLRAREREAAKVKAVADGGAVTSAADLGL